MNLFTKLFPLWVSLASLASFLFPNLLSGLESRHISILLSLIMLGMGLTLEKEDFLRVRKLPLPIILGVSLQYLIMPLTGFGIAWVLQLSPALWAGLILVACCPGGTASNVICYLARADVALSVTLTTLSTVLAVVFTPFFTSILIGNRVEVNGWGLFVSTLQVIIAPVAIGYFLKTLFPKKMKLFIPFAPPIAVVSISLIVASVIGKGKENFLISGSDLFLAVFLLHSIGFFLGYVLSFAIFKNKKLAQTISIEVGMQNSGLGVILAKLHFVDPLTALPSAISSLCHSLIGSLLAALWSRKNPYPEMTDSQRIQS